MTWLETPDDAGELAALATRLSVPEDFWRLASEQRTLMDYMARRGQIESARIDTTRAWLYGVQQDILNRVTWPGHDHPLLPPRPVFVGVTTHLA